MPTVLHEVLVDLVRLLPDALADALGLPSGDWQVASGDLNEVFVVQRAGDVVLLRVEDIAVAVEVQRTRDPKAPVAWAFGLMALAKRYGPNVTLVVLTDRREVAGWARRGFRVSPCVRLEPVVLGPDEVAALARGGDRPLFTLLRALFVCADDDAEPIIADALATAEQAGADVAVWFIDALYSAGGTATRRLLEAYMNQFREFTFPPFQRAAKLHYDRGRDAGLEQGLERGLERGLEQGREQGFERGAARMRRTLLVRLMTRRFGHTDPAWEALAAAADEATVEGWLDRLLDAATPEHVFGDG